jgi:hypothetical protein
MQDPERMAYLQIIEKLIRLINPEKFVELERLDAERHLAIMQQLQMNKRQLLDYDLAAKQQQQQEQIPHK